MALPFTDTFTDTDEVALATHNAGWTVDTGAIVIRSNTARGNASGASYARWTTDLPSNDQSAEGVWAGTNSNGSISSAIMTRLSSSQNGYYYWVTGAASRLYRLNAGSATQLSAGGSVSNGATIKLSSEGTTHTCLLNGSTTGAPSAQVDATHASGYGGLRLFNVGDSASIDSVTYDNIGGGGGFQVSWAINSNKLIMSN